MALSQPAGIFLSYAHSTPERRQVITDLTTALRAAGLNVVVDTDVKTPQGPPEGWLKWMKRQVSRASWVLMMFDDVYRRRFDGEEAAGVGLGGTWEGAIITAGLYRASGVNDRFIPLLEDGIPAETIPDELFAFTRYRIPSDLAKLVEGLAQSSTRQASSPENPLAGVQRPESTSIDVGEGDSPAEPIQDIILQAKAVLAQARRRAGGSVDAEGVSAREELLVNRDQLDTLINAARHVASKSVISLSGDLSWLERDLPRLQELRKKRPSLRIMVFFDKGNVRADAAPLLKQVEELQIELRPYPVAITRLKCLLVDRDGHSPRAFTFRRIGVPTVDGEKPQAFVWREYGSRDVTEIDSIKALVASLELLKAEPIVVAITGVNNIGKSELARRLRTAFGSRMSVEITDDVFKVGSHTTSINDNFVMLWKQKLIEDGQSSAQLRILDRSLVDNFCFLMVRGATHKDAVVRNATESLCARLAADIATAAGRYSLIVDVRRADNNYRRKTRRVKGLVRIAVRQTLDQFFRDHHLMNIYTVKIDSRRDHISASVDAAVAEIAEEVKRIALERRVSVS